MQLTAKFAVLAAALAYGSTSVLALPVGGPSFFAREYDIEARDVPTEVSYVAREVPELSLDARSFFDAEEFEARAVSVLRNVYSFVDHLNDFFFRSPLHPPPL